MPQNRVLILGGTLEARRLSLQLANLQAYDVTTSLKGITSAPQTYGGTVITGGFGGLTGFQNFLHDNNIGICINAAHPFAATMTSTAQTATTTLNVPYLRLRRGIWKQVPGDIWDVVSTMEGVKNRINRSGRVFLAIGSQGMEMFSHLTDARFLIRTVDPVDTERRWPNARYVTGLPNQSVEIETDLLERENIVQVVARNSGGAAGYSKLVAARALGLSVILVSPPAERNGASVETVEEAVTWLESCL